LLSRLVTKVACGVYAVAFYAAAFAVFLVIVLPEILFRFGLDWIRERIETRWPESDRAKRVSSWIGCLAPVVAWIGLVVVMLLAIRTAAQRAGS
jgi:hypothetical protein